MRLSKAVLISAVCWVACVKSTGANVDCNDHSKFGGPCLQRACCRNLERIVTRYCPASQGQQAQPSYNTYQPCNDNNNNNNNNNNQGRGQQQQNAGVPAYNTVESSPGSGPLQSHEGSTAIRCRSEGEFERKDLLTNGKVDVEKVVAFLGQIVTVNDPNWSLQLLRNATTRCAVRAEVIVIESGYENCKSGAYELKRCLELDLFEFCPDSNWNNAPQCREARDYVRHCPIKPEVTNWQEENRPYQPAGWVGV